MCILSSHLQYEITAWGNAAAKFIDKLQIQQNYIIKIMTGSSFFRTKLFSIYCEVNLLKLSNIYKLEALKFVYKFRARLLPSSLLITSTLRPKFTTCQHDSVNPTISRYLLFIHLLRNALFNIKVAKYGMNYQLKLKAKIKLTIELFLNIQKCIYTITKNEKLFHFNIVVSIYFNFTVMRVYDALNKHQMYL